MIEDQIFPLEDNRGVLFKNTSTRGKRGNRGVRTRAEYSTLDFVVIGVPAFISSYARLQRTPGRRTTHVHMHKFET